MTLEGYWNSFYGSFISFGPKLLAAVAIIVLAIIVGYALSAAARYLIGLTAVGKRTTSEGHNLGQAVGKALFWIAILVSLPAALGALGMEGLLRPMQSMADRFLNFLPSLIGAGLIFGVGWAIAMVIRNALVSVLEAAQADRLVERIGLSRITGTANISKFVGVLVFTLLIIPVAIAALDALEIRSISGPATTMLQSFLDAIPNIFAAAIVLLLAFVIGHFAREALINLLPTLGLDQVGNKIGLTGEVMGEASLSKIAGYIAYFAIVIFGVIEAAKLLNFAILSDLLSDVLSLAGHILLGSIIIGFGVILADFVARILEKSRDAQVVSGFVRIAIIILAVAMGLRQMGVANEIINIGFALLIGAVAVGAAIAIGWGGKDTANRLLEKWTKKL